MSELELLRLHQVLALVPVGRTTLYELIARDQFPRPSKLGPRINVWSRVSVETFVRKKIGVLQASSVAQDTPADARPQPACAPSPRRKSGGP